MVITTLDQDYDLAFSYYSVDSDHQFETIFMAIFIYSQRFSTKSTERKAPIKKEKIFFFLYFLGLANRLPSRLQQLKKKKKKGKKHYDYVNRQLVWFLLWWNHWSVFHSKLSWWDFYFNNDSERQYEKLFMAIFIYF